MTLDRAATATYIAEMTRELANLAQAAHLPVTTYCLKVAEESAIKEAELSEKKSA